MALATFLHLLRPKSLEEQHAQRAYRVEVEHVAARLQRVFDHWVAMREVEPDNVRLANAAAVNRWELMRLAKHSEALAAPRSLAGTQRAIHGAVLSSARACQLLANGYRFHKSEAVCDGQAMLVQSVADLADLLTQVPLD